MSDSTRLNDNTFQSSRESSSTISITTKIQGRYRWRGQWNSRPFDNIVQLNSANNTNSKASFLDAWIAEVRREEELVFGEDNRIQVQNTTITPWSTICALRITAADGSRWSGTGWFSAPYTVITAGHCVYMRNNGGWVDNIIVSPGKNGSVEPFGSCMATNFYTVNEWIQNADTSHDYGAIILPRDCTSNGFRVGYFKYGFIGNTQGDLVNISGYPGDKPVGTQWYDSNIIESVTNSRLIYHADTAGGQSGAPVWFIENGRRQVIGIHTNGDVNGNYATLINNDVFHNIQEWSRI